MYLFEKFLIFFTDAVRNAQFQKMNFAQNLYCLSTKSKEKGANLTFRNCPKSITFPLHKKVTASAGKIEQPLLSIELFISDLIEVFIKFLKNYSSSKTWLSEIRNYFQLKAGRGWYSKENS